MSAANSVSVDLSRICEHWAPRLGAETRRGVPDSEGEGRGPDMAHDGAHHTDTRSRRRPEHVVPGGLDGSHSHGPAERGGAVGEGGGAELEVCDVGHQCAPSPLTARVAERTAPHFHLPAAQRQLLCAVCARMERGGQTLPPYAWRDPP